MLVGSILAVRGGEVLEVEELLPTRTHWGLIADLGEGKVLHEANPTTGAEQALVSGWNHGAKWTIKLFDLRSGAFVTVIPHVWGPVDFGPFTPSEKTAAR
jgi:hypothetical protein